MPRITGLIPSPVLGYNGEDNIQQMDDKYAISLNNMYCSTKGVNLRNGITTKYAFPSLDNNTANSVVAILDYIESQLLICCRDGIYKYDENAVSPAPPIIPLIKFVTPLTEPAYVTSRVVTNDDGLSYLVIAIDSPTNNNTSNVWVYNGTTLSQAKVFARSTPESEAVAVNVHGLVKYSGVIWFFDKKKRVLYYTTAVQIDWPSDLPLKVFPLGGFLLSGDLVAVGEVAGDGSTASGVQSYLALINQLGNVLIYSGQFPDADSPPWTIRSAGNQISRPLGLNGVIQFQNDLIVATEDTYVLLNQQIQIINGGNFSISEKIRKNVKSIVDVYGVASPKWQGDYWTSPSQGNSQIVFITPSGEVHVCNANTGAWGIWNLPSVRCIRNFNGKLYFGFDDGRLALYDEDTYTDDGVAYSFNLQCNFSYHNTINEKTVFRVTLSIDGSIENVVSLKICKNFNLQNVDVYTLPIVPNYNYSNSRFNSRWGAESNFELVTIWRFGYPVLQSANPKVEVNTKGTSLSFGITGLSGNMLEFTGGWFEADTLRAV